MTTSAPVTRLTNDDRRRMTELGRKLGLEVMTHRDNVLYFPNTHMDEAGQYLAIAATDSERRSLYICFEHGARNVPNIWQSLLNDLLYRLRDKTNYYAFTNELPSIDWTYYK